MIKKVLIGLLMPATLWANSHQFNELTEVKDSIPVELYFSNFDKNLDSLMRMWYSQESIGSDPIISEMAHDVLPFVPELNDSIIILTPDNGKPQSYKLRYKKDAIEGPMGLKRSRLQFFKINTDGYEDEEASIVIFR